MSRSQRLLVLMSMSGMLTISGTSLAQSMSIEPDARVRLSLKGKWYDDDRSRLVGIVELIDDDTLRLKLDRNSAVALAPRASIGSFSVAAPRTRWNGARMGLGQKLVLGVLASPIVALVQLEHGNHKDVSTVVGRTNAISLISGMTVEAIIGARMA